MTQPEIKLRAGRVIERIQLKKKSKGVDPSIESTGFVKHKKSHANKKHKN
jgi:hypothetical protein